MKIEISQLFRRFARSVTHQISNMTLWIIYFVPCGVDLQRGMYSTAGDVQRGIIP